MSKNPQVLVVLANWKRPQNIGEISAAITNQTVPCTLAMFDNSPNPLDRTIAGQFVEYMYASRNYGPPCRFLPALLRIDHEYTLFLDDDLVPGPRAVEHLLNTAEALGGRFSTIGEVGRRFCGGIRSHLGRRGDGQWRYVPRNVQRNASHPVPVDMTARAHFVRTRDVYCAMMLYWTMLRDKEQCERAGVNWNDDILLCQGIQRAIGRPSFLTPIASDECSLRMRDIPDPRDVKIAVSSRPGHRESRTSFIRSVASLSWSSLWEDWSKDRQKGFRDFPPQEL